MKKSLNASPRDKARMLLLALASYALLLAMSYGFPVTGDDWTFSLRYGATWTLWDPFVRSYEVSLHHYITTNGRLLGNFLVTFLCYSKIVRELVRCGIIFGILLNVWKLSGSRSVTAWLTAFALLIAMPAQIVSETYTWAAGFCNYVPPTLLFLIYIRFAAPVFCGGERRRGFGWAVLLFLLGLCAQFFMENFSIGLCLLSATVFVIDLVRRKRLDAVLAAHLLGAAIGCAVMFLAPGYRNVNTEGYREVANSLSGLLSVIPQNFKRLSYLLTGNNLLVVVPLCLGGIAVCWRSLSETAGKKKLLLRLCILCFTAFPVLSYGIRTFGRYLFAVDLLAHVGYFTAIILTAALGVRNTRARYVLIVSACSFLVFIAPLLLVTPVGSRNAYFFDVLLILIVLTLFTQAVKGLPEVRLLAPALALAACLLLAGNLNIHYRNGRTEQLRNSIVEEAMARGDTEITIPGYPYPVYIHGAEQIRAIGRHYYYKKQGDIAFSFIPYKQWVERH